jgi:hypothetical protein
MRRHGEVLSSACICDFSSTHSISVSVLGASGGRGSSLRPAPATLRRLRTGARAVPPRFRHAGSLLPCHRNKLGRPRS